MATRKIAPAKTPRASVSAKAPAVKPPVRTPAAKATAKPLKAAPAAKQAAAPSVKPSPEAKPKLVRDSFTMPKAEYAVIEQLKRRASALERPAKKSELLRAGIKALSSLSDEALLATLRAVPIIKTGRPKH